MAEDTKDPVEVTAAAEAGATDPGVPAAGAPEPGADPASWGEDDDAGAERILNQDEIDSLLGFDLSEDEGGERTGIRAIINSALVSYERLPMLEIEIGRAHV